MKEVRTPRKALFALVWGVLLCGGSTALAITLLGWHATHRIGTPSKVVDRFPTGPNAEYSRDWTGVINQIRATPDTLKAVAIARTAGLEVTGDYPGLSANGASQPSTDNYFVSFVDPITKGEVLRMSIIIDRMFPPGASSSAPSRNPSTNQHKSITRNEK